jgi:hypothetical protein
MLQDLTELDFDTYFDVASSNQQQLQQQEQQQLENRDVLYHGSINENASTLNSLLNSKNSPLENTQSTFQYTLSDQNNSFDIFDWDISSHQITKQKSTLSSPQSSSDAFSPHSLSTFIDSPPYTTLGYAFNENIKNETNGVFDCLLTTNKKTDYMNDVHFDGNVPGITIPSTPINELPSDSKNFLLSPLTASTCSVSPRLDENKLDCGFPSIDSWEQLKSMCFLKYKMDIY